MFVWNSGADTQVNSKIRRKKSNTCADEIDVELVLPEEVTSSAGEGGVVQGGAHI